VNFTMSSCLGALPLDILDRRVNNYIDSKA